MVLIPASSATSAVLLAHAQLGNIAGKLPFSSSFFFHADSEYSIFCSQIQLSGHFMLLLHGPSSFLFSSSYALVWSVILLPCLWLLPALLCSASFTGLFSNSDSPGSCLMLPDEWQLWRGASAHALRFAACVLGHASTQMLMCLCSEVCCTAALESVPWAYMETGDLLAEVPEGWHHQRGCCKPLIPSHQVTEWIEVSLQYKADTT